jgi:hypothetical protein
MDVVLHKALPFHADLCHTICIAVFSLFGIGCPPLFPIDPRHNSFWIVWKTHVKGSIVNGLSSNRSEIRNFMGASQFVQHIRFRVIRFRHKYIGILVNERIPSRCFLRPFFRQFATRKRRRRTDAKTIIQQQVQSMFFKDFLFCHFGINQVLQRRFGGNVVIVNRPGYESVRSMQSQECPVRDKIFQSQFAH